MWSVNGLTIGCLKLGQGVGPKMFEGLPFVLKSVSTIYIYIYICQVWQRGLSSLVLLQSFPAPSLMRSVPLLLGQFSAIEQCQKPPTNSLSKLVNSNLPVEAKTAVAEACGSHRVSIW